MFPSKFFIFIKLELILDFDWSERMYQFYNEMFFFSGGH